MNCRSVNLWKWFVPAVISVILFYFSTLLILHNMDCLTTCIYRTWESVPVMAKAFGVIYTLAMSHMPDLTVRNSSEPVSECHLTAMRPCWELMKWNAKGLSVKIILLIWSECVVKIWPAPSIDLWSISKRRVISAISYFSISSSWEVLTWGESVNHILQATFQII